MKKILVAEDEAAIREFIVINLKRNGYDVTDTENGEKALEAYYSEGGDFDIVLLDIMMPGIDGLEVCKQIRQDNNNIGIIMLTAKTQEIDKITGLIMGADDYVCKPFRIGELMARIKTVLRRSGRNKDSEAGGNDGILAIKNVRIHTGEAKVGIVNETTGKEDMVELTALEYRLLLSFCNNRGTVMTRSRLLENMWDVNGDFVNDNTLTVYIKRLRDKIEKDPADPQIIKTIRGIGYILDK